ncbi:MAG TPA: polysaccharide deacetylase family protein [Dongiaceae bacterium]|nr:polysaccharide deacetylase family protein [Dongiaceae bacterium]
MTEAWSLLGAELSQWQARGLTADLWWRDDDAVSDTPALRRLIRTARVPVALAVIPAALQQDLAQLLSAGQDTAHVAVLQHGFAHYNHEPAGSKKAELGAARPAETVLSELAAGAAILRRHFGSRALPVLTPPWNRIAPAVTQGLAPRGFRGLTTYLPRAAAQPFAGLRQVNTHVDIIDWHGDRGFLGIEPTLALLIRHLRARRLGHADATEPTGILTHHLVHDEASWAFLERLQDWLSGFPMIRWLTAPAVFANILDQKEE